MRTVHIDFLNTENPLPDGNILGNQGEHNATVLAVTPPAEMTDNESITYYRIAFELTNCRTVHSSSIAKADVISLPLFSQITSSETVAVQLEGYDGNGDVIVKSPKITKLKFNPSVCGVEIPPSDSPNSMAADVAANTEFRKQFTKERPTASIELTAEQGLIVPGIDVGLIEGSFAICDLYGALDENILPVGTEIAKIELRREDDDPETGWIDINEMYKRDGSFMQIVYSEVFLLNGCRTIAVAISQGCGESFIIEELNVFSNPVARVTYYTD